MTKQQFLEHALNTYGTSPDYPFDDNLETAVLLPDANEETVAFLTNASFEATRTKIKPRKAKEKV